MDCKAFVVCLLGAQHEGRAAFASSRSPGLLQKSGSDGEGPRLRLVALMKHDLTLLDPRRVLWQQYIPVDFPNLFCTGGNCRFLRDLYHFYLLIRSANDLLYYNITMCWGIYLAMKCHDAHGIFFVKYESYWYIHCIIWYEYWWVLYEFYIVLRCVAGQLNWIYVLFFHTLFPTVWFIYHIRFCTCWTCSTILPVVYASSIQNPCWIIDCIANFLRYNTFQHFISS